MKLILTIFLLMIILVAEAQDFNKISWNDLVPKVEFDDPFLKLSSEQLYNLSQVAKYREKVASIDTDSRIKEQTKIDSLEQQLQSENVNIDSLLSLRSKITELRREKAESVNKTLDKTEVSISGYLLPLNYVDEKTTEFLLVPWVGACIHTPPPPKNQIVYLKSEKGYSVGSRFEAVTVKGLIETKDKSSLLYLVDGSDHISTGYSVLNAEIIKYSD